MKLPMLGKTGQIEPTQAAFEIVEREHPNESDVEKYRLAQAQTLIDFVIKHSTGECDARPSTLDLFSRALTYVYREANAQSDRAYAAVKLGKARTILGPMGKTQSSLRGDLMRQIASLHAVLDRTTKLDDRRELEAQITELTQQMMADRPIENVGRKPNKGS